MPTCRLVIALSAICANNSAVDFCHISNTFPAQSFPNTCVISKSSTHTFLSDLFQFSIHSLNCQCERGQSISILSPSSSVHAPTQTNNRSRNKAIQLARELGPQVVRIDCGAFDEDESEGGKNQGENEDDDVSFQTPLASHKKKTEVIFLFAKSHRVMHMLIRQSDTTSPNQSEAETEFYYSTSATDELESGDEGQIRLRSSSASQSGGAGKQQPQVRS